ncbi:hypothetical protein FOTG_13787 [Fusarium oxysporum f. sp. vasinfectum 25433]|uniref:Uncharacterized protein n=1 Tax=Fusarium oxysporum f. sp. vasinfectum 25433 TaxID=1089449 RepID=X0LAD6_FUSOX|nr:hypothetical protein FOTG_13787 [Fusarium oxysporum f. sp. vasinfectum 25433]
MWKNLANLSHALGIHKHSHTASALMVQPICEPHFVRRINVLAVFVPFERGARALYSLLSVVTEDDNPESVDTTSTGTPKPEDTQDGAQSDNDGLLAPNREDKIAEEAASVHADCPLKRHVSYSLIPIAFIGSACLICSCWLIAHIQAKTDNGYIAAVIVGGKLSSTEAKLIEAAFSILVAPAVVAVAN